MNIRTFNIVFFSAILLTGFYAGIGFFGFMGFNPTVLEMSSHNFAEYWQHLDYYMGARMPFFGLLHLIVLLAAVLIHIPRWRTASFWFLATAFLLLMADATVAVTTNRPLNGLIQSWDLNKLPADVQNIKLQVVNAFWYRNAFMIGSFVCVLLAAFLRRK